MNILVTGGAKNGKSTKAEGLAQGLAEKLNKPLYYIATMIPHDEEDEERIRRHVRSRAGKGFITIECGKNILESLKEYEGVFLLDSVTALLSNEMFDEEGFHEEAGKMVLDDLLVLAKEKKDIVFVSDYIYEDAMKYDELTEHYRMSLAKIERELSKVCEKVFEVTFGVSKEWK